RSKGGTQKLFFFINDLFSNTLLVKLFLKSFERYHLSDRARSRLNLSHSLSMGCFQNGVPIPAGIKKAGIPAGFSH
ncbi:hypothetical protein, partial [Novacetimonas hansenii]|uniref:hypothetical protein n=1 Tax=Novacetimonas hansenii TaxID=436 RepID=UPI001A7F0257